MLSVKVLDYLNPRVLTSYTVRPLMPQGNSSKNFGSSKISRISFVDLAGLDRKKVDVAGSAKEGKHVKKSLARLGYAYELNKRFLFGFLV